MKHDTPSRISVSFPGELEYIPLVRKLFSDILQVLRFSAKFTFRSEFIIDELCNNAVTYGSSTEPSPVELICEAYRDRVEFTVKDSGGAQEHITRLRQAVDAAPLFPGASGGPDNGLELVRMLAEEVTCTIDDRNVTQVHVVRKRKEAA
ncbi:MAG: ATP-binding protein [Chitinispirillaceae bacterium]|nr:ATP-binding protein [Chitinispirillaceae bacterium]